MICINEWSYKSLCLNIKFSVIGLTQQPSLHPNEEISAIIQGAISDSFKPHHHIIQLPCYLRVGGELSLKVTRGNVYETRLSGYAFNLVTFFFEPIQRLKQKKTVRVKILTLDDVGKNSARKDHPCSKEVTSQITYYIYVSAP